MDIHEETAVQLAYLLAGVEPVLQTYAVAQCLAGGDDHPILRDGGHIGMVTELLPFAKIVAQYVEDAVGKQDFPGVFEYEVTEELGTWLANSHANPSHDSSRGTLFIAELKKLGAFFFIRSFTFYQER